MLPVEYMLRVLNGIDQKTEEPFTEETRPTDERLDRLAIAAAPFIHRRLAPINVEATEPEPKSTVDLESLNDEELSWLERIVMKGRSSS